MIIIGGVNPKELKKEGFSVFNSEVINILDRVSRKIIMGIKKQEIEETFLYFAMWIRKRNLEKLKEMYKTECRYGRGISVHIAPTNVPTNTLFTIAFGLLSGNSVAVRVSERLEDQISKGLRIFDKEINGSALPNIYSAFKCEYEDSDWNDLQFESRALVIWGGDRTVQNVITEYKNKTVKFLTFPNRTSLAVLDPIQIDLLDEKELNRLARNLANDIYLFGQRACSSPRLMMIKGEQSNSNIQIVKRFLNSVGNYGSKLAGNGIDAKDCFVNAQRISTERKIRNLSGQKNLFAPLYQAEDVEVNLDNIIEGSRDAALPIVFEDEWEHVVKYTRNDTQTLILAGVTSILEAAKKTTITRIVEAGNALNIGIIWDGYDIISELTRRIENE